MPAERLVPHILFQQILRADHEILIAAACARIGGERLDITVAHKVQRAPGLAVTHLDHAVAQLIVADPELFCQFLANELQLIAHMAAHMPQAVQFLSDAFSEQRAGRLQAQPASMGLPLDPLDGAASVLLKSNRLPLTETGDVAAVQTLKLEE